MKRKKCSCTGRSGEPKMAYMSQRGAMNAALAGGRSGAFRTYRCPQLRNRWHVTHA